MRVRPDGRVAGPLPWPEPALTDGRILLDRFVPGDVDALVVACGDPEIRRWLALPDPYTAEAAREFVRIARQAATVGAELTFAVRNPAAVVLGAVALHLADARPGEAEIGYWTAAPARRRGVAVTAVRLLARWAFTKLPLRRIEILIEQGNVASCRVAEQAGAVAEGVRRAGIDRRGRRFDPLVYGLVASDL